MRRLLSQLITLSLLAVSCAARLDLDRPLASADVTSADVEVSDTPSAPVGESGTPCGHDAECLSGACTNLTGEPGGSVCTIPCGDGCPTGFECLDTTGGVCVPGDLCLDTDGDRFGFGGGCIEVDCDDLNAATYPGATERCDSEDNDCDGRIDDEPLHEGLDCDTGLGGACASGVITCVDGEERCVLALVPGDELCNGLDDNCDGFIDNDPVDGFARYADADGDGHGDPSVAVRVCGDSPGVAETPDDCDDTDPASYPGATELCDERDNDCDGTVDEDVVDQAFYPDSDGDGYGAPSGDSVVDCVPPDGYAPVAGDCHDGDAGIRPGADELPGDEVDQNCDGVELCLRDQDGDGYAAGSGDTVVSDNVSCDDPGEASVGSPSGDCNDDSAATRPDATEWCDRVDNDCDGAIDDDCVCPEGMVACDGDCIASDACCSDDDCSGDLVCSVPGDACACPSGGRLCEAACIPTDACCVDGDCDRGAVCPSPGGICACTPHAHQACDGPDVYWFDSCDNREEIADDCSGGEVCQSGTCACTANASRSCDAGDVYWFDSCGNRGSRYDDCGANETCSGNACISTCAPNASRACSGGDVYWYDSCGNRGGIASDCSASQACCGSTCVTLGTNDNCGGCGDACGQDRSCVSGTCSTCDPGQCGCSSSQRMCGGSCVPAWNNRDHCGACGNVCESYEDCMVARCEEYQG